MQLLIKLTIDFTTLKARKQTSEKKSLHQWQANKL